MSPKNERIGPLDGIQVLLDDDIYRVSRIKKGFINRRRFKLSIDDNYRPLLTSFHSSTDNSPSKTWTITPRCTLSHPSESRFHLRGDHTPTLFAYARGKTHSVTLSSFTLTFHSPSTFWGGVDHLTLCFDGKEQAIKWHTTMSNAIYELKNIPSTTTIENNKNKNNINMYTYGQHKSEPSPPQHHHHCHHHMEHPIHLSDKNLDDISIGLDGDDNSTTNCATMYTDAPTSHPITKEKGRWRWRSIRHVNGIAVYIEDNEESNDDSSSSSISNSSEAPVVMVAAVVRAPPSKVCRALLKSGLSSSLDNSSSSSHSVAGGGGGLLGEGRLIANLDKHTQITAHEVHVGGILGALCAPREVLLMRTWLQDEDGTYIVLYQSSDNSDSSNQEGGRRKQKMSSGASLSGEGGGGWNISSINPINWLLSPWRRPVKARVHAAGFTIAPLLPEYRSGGEVGAIYPDLSIEEQQQEDDDDDLVHPTTTTSKKKSSSFSMLSSSQHKSSNKSISTTAATAATAAAAPSSECLVTVIIKLDLAGSIGTHSLISKLAPCITSAAHWAIIDPIILSLVAFRDGIEQSRFTLRPTSDVMPGDAEEEEEAEGELENYGGRRVSYSRPPLLPEEEQERDGIRKGEGEEEQQEQHTVATPPSSPPPPLQDAWAIQGTCPGQNWGVISPAGMKVRGRNYLLDKKKIPASPPLLDLYAADLVNVEEPLWHIARYLPSVKYSPAPFHLVLNIMYPAGSYAPMQCLVATWTCPVHPMHVTAEELVAACCLRDEEVGRTEEEERGEDNDGSSSSKSCDPDGSALAGAKLLQEWMKGDGAAANAQRNKILKMIPRIAKGPWLVKKAVGTTPVLLGQKLTTKYHRGDNYFEIDIDISSDTVARSVTGLVVGTITSLVVDWCILLEGKSEEQLPERILGSVRFDHLDLKCGALFGDENGRLYPPEKVLK